MCLSYSVIPHTFGIFIVRVIFSVPLQRIVRSRIDQESLSPFSHHHRFFPLSFIIFLLFSRVDHNSFLFHAFPFLSASSIVQLAPFQQSPPSLHSFHFYLLFPASFLRSLHFQPRQKKNTISFFLSYAYFLSWIMPLASPRSLCSNSPFKPGKKNKPRSKSSCLLVASILCIVYCLLSYLQIHSSPLSLSLSTTQTKTQPQLQVHPQHSFQ